MKSITFLILLFTLTVHLLFAQTLKYNTIVEYTTTISWENPQSYPSKLYIGDTTTCFILKEPKAASYREDRDMQTAQVIFATHSANLYLKNKSDNFYLCSEQIFNKSFIVKDVPPRINWQIAEETKVIEDKYLCKKAVGEFRGRIYTVWFTEDIPLSFGFFKLEGLYGLILEAYDNTGEVQFKLKSISNDSGQLDLSINDVEMIDWDYYEKLSKEKIKRIKAYLESSTSDAQIGINVSKIKAIEQSIYEDF